MRRSVLLGLVLLLAAAASLFTQPAEHASAQSQALVSNIGQSDSGRGAYGNDQAQAFTTGSNAAGYTLNSVDIEFAGLNDNSALSSKLTVTINSSPGNIPGAVLATLTNPSDQTFTSDRTLNFTAPGAGINLAANTRYWVVLDITGSISGQTSSDGLRNTASDGEDSGAAAGFSVDNDSGYRAYNDGDPQAWLAFNQSKKIRINGSVKQLPTANADGSYSVPEDWALIPSGIGRGDKFRLMFMTQDMRDATATDIAVYDTFVQGEALGGHAAIQDYAPLFKVVGSTSAVDARDHLDMNPNSDGAGHPVYWLNGPRIADDTAEFWSNTWQNWTVIDRRNADGIRPTGAAGNDWHWTGTNADGTKAGSPLGNSPNVVRGRFFASTGDTNPISHTNSARGQSHTFYAMSPVFIVTPPTVSISIKDGHTDIDEGGTRTLVFTLDRPAPTGGTDLGDPGIPTGGTLAVAISTIPAGQTTLEYTLSADDDSDYTPGRVMTLTYPNQNNLPTSGSLTITLSVNDNELPQDSAGNYIVPEDWPLLPQGFGPGDRFRLMFMTQGMRNAIPTNIDVYDAYVQGEAETGHTAIRPYADTFKVVGSTSAVDARDHLEMTGAGHPVYWLRGPRIADNTAEFWSDNWQNWTLAHRRNANGNGMSGAARSDWHWTGTRADGTAHPQLPLGSFDRVMRGRYLSFTSDRDPIAHTGTPRGQDHSFYAMSPVFVVDGLTYLDPGSNPQTGKLVEIDKTIFKVAEPASCTDPDEGRKQNVRDSDREGKWESTIADATTYSYNVRLARDPALDPKIDTVKVEVVGGSPPDWWTAHRAGFVTVEDKAPDIEPKQVLHFDSSNWNQWQNVQLRIHCADHFLFGDVPYRQFRHVSYTNNKRRDGRTFLQNEEPVVKVKVFDNRIPPLKDSYSHELSMQAETNEYGFRGDDSQVINYVYWQWKLSGVTGNVDSDADKHFSHWHMRLIADNSVGGNAPDHVKNVSTDAGYSFNPDGRYKAGMRMRGLPTKTPGTAPDPKQYRLDITPVTLREEMAEGAKLTVCLEMRDVRPDWDTPNWRAFYIPCTPALNALSPQQMAPPVTPTVFIAGAGGGDEGQGSVFFINTNPKPTTPLQVNVEVTATGDYGVTTGTRTITIPTTGLYDLNIATVDDKVDEDDGTVTLTLRDGDGYTVGPGNTETTDVFDNDLPLAPAIVTPAVNVTGASGGNEGEDAVFTLESNPKTDAALDVNIDVTATGKYGVKTGKRTVTIPASGSLSLSIPTRDDGTDEPDGTVTVTLQAGDGYEIGAQASGTADILDNDLPPIQVTVADAIAQEGDDLEFVISLDRAASKPIDVYYNTLDWDAWSPDDYASAGGTAVFAPGETQQTVRVSTVADGQDEWGNEDQGKERMIFDLSGAWAPGVQVEIGDQRAIGTISDDPVDTTPKPELSISGGSGITEGGTATFTITASFAPESPITVKVGVSQSGNFGVSTGTKTVTVSGVSTTYTVTTTNDNNDEPNGSVTATLQSGSGYTVSSSNGAATVSVSDDDLPPPVASITGGNGITEGGTASFTITVNPAPTSPITVKVGVSQSGNFGVNTGTKTVTVSGGTATYTVTTTDDNADEADGSVTATLQSGSGYTVSSSQGTATVNVADDDATPEVNVTGAVSGPEGQDVTFTLTANPAPGANLPVSVTVTASGDYGVSTGTWVETIPTGGSVIVTLTTTDDSTDEPNGSVTLTLNGGQGYTVGSLSSETVTVTDNDEPRQPLLLPDPEVSITAGSGITEGGTATFTITANPAPSSPITVNVGVSETGDFGASGSATVQVSGASTTYTVTTTNDNADEPDGSVTATLQTGSGYTVSSSQGAATVAVSDDDVPEVSITAGSGITEGGTATFTITANPAPASPMTVKVGVSENGDFGASGAATVTVSGASTTYTVTTINDNADEADGSVTATLQTGSGYTVSSSQGAASVAVSDDDVPEVSITAGSGITEGGAASFTITANPAPASPITVKVGVSEDGDFGASGSATVTGERREHDLHRDHDRRLGNDEADGSVTATLQSGSGYTVSSSQGAATVAVSDDDHPTPEVSITAGSGITEGGTATFTITANPAPASPDNGQGWGQSQNGDFGASGSATVTVSGASTTYTIDHHRRQRQTRPTAR